MQNSRTIWRTIIMAAGLTILVLLIRDFNSRMADLRRLTADLERVSAQVTQLAATKQYLETQVVIAASDEAVRRYAYEEAGLQLPGDEIVVLVPGEEAQQEQATVIPTAPPPVEKWQLWLTLFLDTPAIAGNSP